MDIKNKIPKIINNILNGREIDYEVALELISIDNDDNEALDMLFEGANRIRERYMGKNVDLCTIMNAKSGKCSEDCKFCAQSVHYSTGIGEYQLLDYDEILNRAKEMEAAGAHRFSLVTSGKGLNVDDFHKVVEIYRRLSKDTNLKLCASHGLITYEMAMKLKDAGVSMYHHNVESSKNYYEEICTTHTYEERLETIKNLNRADMEICCGGILGMGEDLQERIKMAYEIKELGIKSVPLNVLNPVKGTPLQGLNTLTPMEILKTMAVFRYIIPDSYIRYAGGRAALEDKQDIGFKAGVNAALVGNYLTTIGSNIEKDKEMIICQGLEI